MSKMKLLLDVVSDLRSLADSLQAVAGRNSRIKPRRKGRLRNRKRKLPRRKRSRLQRRQGSSQSR